MKYLFLFLTILCFTSCTENYSNGERIGYITKHSVKGVLFKTNEAHMNVTQTGMNSSEGFDFSIEEPQVVTQINDASLKGYKVKVTYHELWGLNNFFHNRGETSYFVTQVENLGDSIRVTLPKTVQ